MPEQDDERFYPPDTPPETPPDAADAPPEPSVEAVDDEPEAISEPVEAEASPDDDLDPLPQPANTRPFEDETLADVLADLLRAPAATWAKVHAVATTPRHTTPSVDADERPSRWQVPQPAPVPVTDAAPLPDEAPPAPPEPETTVPPLTDANARQREAVLFALRLTSLLLVWWGAGELAPEGILQQRGSVPLGLAFIAVGMLAWLGIEIVAARPSASLKPDAPSANDLPRFDDERVSAWEYIDPVRIVLLVIGFVGSAAAVLFTRGNLFTVTGFFAWMISIIAWTSAMASDRALYGQRTWGLPRLRISGTLVALALILVVGAFFRFQGLDNTPPQMTSDHVEKLLDSQRVLDGQPQIFFPNNGGREPMQMYFMALLSLLPGFSMDFYSLKFLSALEGLVTLPFFWWLGRVVAGEDNRAFGNLLGLALAALAAVSLWHLELSRLALRIILTPWFATMLLIYLARAMRHNRREDFLKAGLILGFGLYAYQAVRMLPVVVIVGVVIAVIARARSWRSFARYAVNFAALVTISFIVFLPMFAFSLERPDLFWLRTTGRLFGDAVITETNEAGELVQRDATIAEQWAAFEANLPVLRQNVANVLLMFHYRGDVAWINHAPNAPHMDPLVGALFFVGLAAWGVRMFTRRDPVDWLVPLMLFIMLMPSALAIAYPIENPSATRTSGALPVALLIAAYPLAILVRSAFRLIPARRVAAVTGGGLVAVVMIVSYIPNAQTYFNRYHDNYLLSSLPYRQAGDQIRVFNREVGGQGNTFMIAFPYWWDHRALGIEGGMIDYPNGIIERGDVPTFLSNAFLREDAYTFNPEQDILFFHAAEDQATLNQLRDWFPAGRSEVITIPEQNRSYATYRVPALGTTAFIDWVQRNSLSEG